LDLNMIKAARSSYIISAVACAIAASSFWVYGSVRAMQETVGLSANDVWLAGAFTAVLLLVPVLTLWLLLRGSPVLTINLFRTAVVLAACAGAIAAETRLLRDEHSFKQEVALAPGRATARDRAWPFQGSALVYQPTRGIHSTD
jgi:hypothetical protein